MSASLDALEVEIADLRSAVRSAVASGDRESASRLLTALHTAERAWTQLLPPLGDEPSAPWREVLPTGVRVSVPAQVRQVLEILEAPAGPQLISAVRAAFFGEHLAPSKLASLRRDEERSFSTGVRDVFVVPALTSQLTPARGLLALSTWPLERRVTTPFSARTDLCTHASAVAARLAQLGGAAPAAAHDLLAQLARQLPGIAGTPAATDPSAVTAAADREAAALHDQDAHARAEAAGRARALPLRDQLFGLPRAS